MNHLHSSILRLTAVAALASLLALALPPVPAARAAAINVNTPDDELNGDGDCSLREAIQAANTDAVVDACAAGSGADTIDVPAGTYTVTYTPPASGSLTDGFTYVVSDGKGGISASYVVISVP